MKLDQHELKIYMNDKYRERVMGFMTAQDIINEVENE